MPSSLSYSCDSPFFAKRSERYDQDLEKLAEFLRTLTKQMRQFCKDTKQLSKSAEAIGIHMKSGMAALGGAGGSSLLPVLACFGDIFSEIANSQEILEESLDNSFTTPLERFCNEEVASVHNLQNQYLAQRENNETIISRYLQSDLSNFGRGSTQSHLDMRAHEVVQQTKRFESVRYDFVRKINEMEARKSFEVAESCVAGILSLNAYYHTCMDRLQASKNFIEELRSQQQRDRAAFEVSMKPLDRKKHDINAVLDAMVERVEMASVFLQTDLNSAHAPTIGAIDGVIMDYSGGAQGSSASGISSPEMTTSSNALSRIGAFMGGFGSSSKGSTSAGRRASSEDAGGGVPMTALCEECEARMKALDHSELIPFFNVRPDEEPAGAVKQGYLWRRVSRKVMDTWERRWFILDDSKYYYISESDDSHRINVVCELILANIRELKSYEVPFCFEVAFANFKTTIVQAEGIKEYSVWIQALRAGIEKSLVSGRPSAVPGQSGTANCGNPGGSHPGASISIATGGSAASRRSIMRPVIDRILSNSPLCAECERPNPEWVSLNIGCLVCIDCSGVHRSMGVHISKMRSLTLDDLEPAEYSMLLQLGNAVINSIWEKEMKVRGANKPNVNSNYVSRDRFIRAKYQYKAFLTNPPVCVVDPPDLNLLPAPASIELWERDVATKALCAAVANNDMYETMRALAADADVSGGLIVATGNQLEEGLISPLVLAIRNGSLEAAVLLIINGASIAQAASAADSTTPLEIAQVLELEGSSSDGDAMTLYHRRGTSALCSYILNKVEPGIRTSSSPKPKDHKQAAEDGGGVGSLHPKDDTAISTRSNSLTMKAKQFMSRSSSQHSAKTSASPVFDHPGGGGTSGPVRYRGASDFGAIPPASPAAICRPRSVSNGDLSPDHHANEYTSADSINIHGSNEIAAGSLKKKAFHKEGNSKISQKMRNAFNSTDFLFLHGNSSCVEKSLPPTDSRQDDEVFHQPFVDRNMNGKNNGRSSSRGFGAGRSSPAEIHSQQQSDHKF